VVSVYCCCMVCNHVPVIIIVIICDVFVYITVSRNSYA